MLDTKELKKSLAEMRDDLTSVKDDAENMKQDISEIQPEELDLDALPADEKKEKEEIVKSPADAKKVLNEAIKDLQSVVDNIDAICGQAEQEIKEASVKRHNEKYASTISTLVTAAEKSISDARDAIKHWAWLVKSKREKIDLQDSSLKQAAQTLQEVSKFDKLLKSLGFKREGTAVPPTNSEFSGDKWPKSGNPAEEELDHWKKGQTKFNSDKSFEDKRPNPAVDNRLTDVDYKRFMEKPSVSASFTKLRDTADSFWDVVDTKSGMRIQASFSNAPAALGSKDQKGFNAFSSKQFGNNIVEAVKTFGISNVKNQLNAKYASFEEGIKKVASDESAVRSYYADAYGDKSYAKEMVKNNQAVKPAPKGYTPKDRLADKKAAKMPARQINAAIIQANAREAVLGARKFASVGAIPFTKAAIAKKAQELLTLKEGEMRVAIATISQLPITNEAALKLSHIPDSEKGIVSNTASGVSSPTAEKVKTEGLDSNVKLDATISKKASLIPQMSSNGVSGLSLASRFTTTEQKLASKGIGLDSIRKPNYRK